MNEVNQARLISYSLLMVIIGMWIAMNTFDFILGKLSGWSIAWFLFTCYGAWLWRPSQYLKDK